MNWIFCTYQLFYNLRKLSHKIAIKYCFYYNCDSADISAKIAKATYDYFELHPIYHRDHYTYTHYAYNNKILQM